MANGGALSGPVKIGCGFIKGDPEEFSYVLRDIEHDVVDEQSSGENPLQHDDMFPLVIGKFAALLGEHRMGEPDEKWVDLYRVFVTNRQENGILENIES